MIRLFPELSKIVRIVPSQKRLIGLFCNVEYKAISAESGTAHGYSPSLAILDEVAQACGPHDAFIEAIETAQGAHDDPLLIVISTKAAKDVRGRQYYDGSVSGAVWFGGCLLCAG